MIARMSSPFPFLRQAGLALAVPLLACLPAPAGAAEFGGCLAAIRASAAAAGVSGATFDAVTAGLQPDMTVLDQMNKQPEFKTPIWDYMAGLVDEERVAQGRAMMAQWKGALAEAQRRFGVDPAVIVAVWGVESNYGQNGGTRPLVQSLA